MVDKTSSDELDYKSFLQELLCFRATGSSSVDDSLGEDGPMLAKKKRKPEEVYEELAFFDFPMLSPDELQVLARDLSETLKKQSHRGPISEEVVQLFQRFPLTRRFILSISQGAAKHIHRSTPSSSSSQSKDHEKEEKEKEITTENKPSDTPPVDSDVSWTAYSSLCAIVFIKMLLILLKMNRQERSDALSSYDTDYHVSIDKQEVVSESREECEKRKNNKEEEEDNDSTPSKVLSKLVDIAVGAHNLGYDLVAGPQGRVWDDLNLSQDLMLLTREMVNIPSGIEDVVQREIESKLRMALLPPVFFLQRDRMLSRPESIPETLVLCLTILRIRDEPEESQEKDKTSRDLREQVAVSILAALSASILTPSQNQSKITEAQETMLASTIEEYIPFLSRRASLASKSKELHSPLQNELDAITQIVQFITERKKASIEVQDLLMKSGLFRELVQVFLKWASMPSMQGCRELLLKLSSQYQNFACWVLQVPKFLQLLQSPEFTSQFSTESITWFLLFSQQGVDTKKPSTTISSSVPLSFSELALEGLQRLVGGENNSVSHIREIAILLYLLKAIKDASKRGDQTKLYSWFLTWSNSSPFLALLEKTASAATLPSPQTSSSRPDTSSFSSSTELSPSSSDSTSGWVIEDLEEDEEEEKRKENEKKPDKKKDVETEKQEEELLRLKRKLRSLHKELFVGGGKSD